MQQQACAGPTLAAGLAPVRHAGKGPLTIWKTAQCGANYAGPLPANRQTTGILFQTPIRSKFFLFLLNRGY
jgi:hypothetical protein